MGALQVKGPDSPFVDSAEEMAGQFSAELMALLPTWKQRLERQPGCFPELEAEVHKAFSRGADLLVVGLLALVMKQPQFAASTETLRGEFALPLRTGRQRKIQVRLLGGLVVWVTSLYCAVRRQPDAPRDKRLPGVHVELAQFAFGKGCSPALEAAVSRQAALCPSYQFATQELERQGLKLDVKTVRRIATQCGEGLLGLRAHELDLWRAGQLPAGTELRGKHLSVQLDGGRTRLRGPLRDASRSPESVNAEGLLTTDAPGRSRRRPKQTFDADWREPKLITIFEHDEHGRMRKRTQATIDGSFEGTGHDGRVDRHASASARRGSSRQRNVRRRRRAMDLGPYPRHYRESGAEERRDARSARLLPRVASHLGGAGLLGAEGSRTLTALSRAADGTAEWTLATSCRPADRAGGRAT
jgi:hypothetical protein